MRTVISRCAVVLAASILVWACAQETAPEESTSAAADLLLVNGAIYTVDSSRSWAQAVAIRDGHIVAVGTDRDVREHAGPATRVVDLHGRMVLPGLHDVHIHALRSGVEQLGVKLLELETLEDYLAAVEAYAVEHPNEEWIMGAGWSIAVFGPGARASRELLDALVPDRPVYLESADGHSAWVNSKALEAAGITAATPDPPNGLIDREPGGNVPLGSLQEKATELVERVAPPVTLEDRLQGMRNAMQLLHSYGITSIQEAKAIEPELEAYRQMDARGELELRIVAALEWDTNLGMEQLSELLRWREEYASDRVKPTTVKIWQDGVMENYTASMLEPYIGKDGARGFSFVEPTALSDAVTRFDAAGFQVHFHAIGDAAIRQSLDAVEAARSANGELGHRHHISHLQLIDPADIPRFRELGVVANFQPLWAYADTYVTELTLPFIGAERARWMYPIASVYRSGGMVAFGSDWSVSSADPFAQIETAITRIDAFGDAGESFIPEERINLPEAIEAFTIAGAWVNGSELKTGSIEVGKFADLVVLDSNLFAIEHEEISRTRALLTLLEGQVVYGDLDRL